MAAVAVRLPCANAFDEPKSPFMRTGLDDATRHYICNQWRSLPRNRENVELEELEPQTDPVSFTPLPFVFLPCFARDIDVV